MITQIDDRKPRHSSKRNTAPAEPKGPRKRAAKKTGRNKKVVITIQQLRSDHKGAGGKFWDPENPTSRERIHGHVFVGKNGMTFITSRKDMNRAQVFSIWTVGDNVREINLMTTRVSHAGAIQLAQSTVN